jgi:hypothetical protein
MDWVREQLAEASRMDPSTVLPLETKADAKVIAHNMLQQLEWDTKRDLAPREIASLIGVDVTEREDIKEFFEGFRNALDSAYWLPEELLEINRELRGGRGVSEAHKSRHGGTAPLKRQQRAGSFVVTLSTGQTARFHDMPRAQDWATERLTGQPAGTYAAFYRAAVGPGRSDTGAPWTEPFHVLIIDEYGHVRVGDARAIAPLPGQHPHRGIREARRGSGRYGKPKPERYVPRVHYTQQQLDWFDIADIISDLEATKRHHPDWAEHPEWAKYVSDAERSAARKKAAFRAEYSVDFENWSAYPPGEGGVGEAHRRSPPRAPGTRRAPERAPGVRRRATRRP